MIRSAETKTGNREAQMDIYENKAHVTLFDDASSRLFGNKNTGCFIFQLKEEQREKHGGEFSFGRLLQAAFPQAEIQVYCLESGDVFMFFPNSSDAIVDSFEHFLYSMQESSGLPSSPQIFDLKENWGHFNDRYIYTMKEMDPSFLMNRKNNIDLFSLNVSKKKRQGRNKKSVLLITAPQDQHIIDTTLKGEQYELIKTEISGNNQDIYKKYAKNAPDFVIIDMDLEALDSAHLIENIYAADPDCAIIPITTQASVQKIFKYVKTGVKGRLEKPLSKQNLLQNLKIKPAKKNLH